MAPIQTLSHWHTLDDQPLSKDTIADLFDNKIACVRSPNFLRPEECEQLIEIIKTHAIGSYDHHLIFPPVGTVGISQFNYQEKKENYLNDVKDGRSLQDQFIKELGVDIVGRVCDLLQQVTGIPTRAAKEGDKEYFAGLLRVIDNFVQPHADYAPYDGPDWEIGRVTAQLTWNVLLKTVPGGDTLIYDRPWRGKADDVKYKKSKPSYAYDPRVLQGNIFKVMPPVQGDLTFFNSRNFHEVNVIDKWVDKDYVDIREAECMDPPRQTFPHSALQRSLK